jgi:predicted nicotinamide N-methyase
MRGTVPPRHPYAEWIMLSPELSSRARAIIHGTTRLAPVPLVPEIALYQADEPIEAWQRVEDGLGRTGTPPPFWAFAWAGGQALARYVLDRPGAVAGRRVLDVAAGSGLVAIAAALAGAPDVIANDIDPLALAAVAANASANSVAIATLRADVLELTEVINEVDTVLIADAFYQQEFAARAMELVTGAQARGARVLVGDPGRAYMPQDRFTALARYGVPGLRALEDTDVKQATVWALRS